MNLKDRLAQLASGNFDPAAANIAQSLFDEWSNTLLDLARAEPLLRQYSFAFEHGADVFRELQRLLNEQGIGINQQDGAVIIHW